jgi:hypothetical protein
MNLKQLNGTSIVHHSDHLASVERRSELCPAFVQHLQAAVGQQPRLKAVAGNARRNELTGIDSQGMIDYR